MKTSFMRRQAFKALGILSGAAAILLPAATPGHAEHRSIMVVPPGGPLPAARVRALVSHRAAIAAAVQRTSGRSWVIASKLPVWTSSITLSLL